LRESCLDDRVRKRLPPAGCSTAGVRSMAVACVFTAESGPKQESTVQQVPEDALIACPRRRGDRITKRFAAVHESACGT
jgi:hypothetical protein